MTLLRRILILSLVASAPLVAQGDTATRRGVYLSLQYDPGIRPGIAVLPVRGANGDSVRAIVQRDLDYGDRVMIVGANADDLPPVSGTPNYDLFTNLGVVGIVAVTVTPDGLKIDLYDVKQKQAAPVKGFPLTGAALSREWRMSVHAASDEVERWATGVRGIAATRVALVRDRKIWVVDSDGAFATVAASEGGVAPAWHPNGRSLAYARLPDVGSSVVIRDLATNAVTQVAGGARSGSYNSPVFSPDGKSMIYSYGVENSDLWSVTLAPLGAPKRITTTSINTSPTFSPDGRQIAFTSGRLIHPEVYIADADGSNAEVLIAGSFGDQAYRANPSWSPDARLIAFASRIDDQFQVMICSPSGKNVTALTSESQNEDPAWAPDGRHLVFTSQRGGSQQLWIVDTESNRMRQLTHGSSAKSGAWSPSLAAQQ